jgi:hypothetical protein
MNIEILEINTIGNKYRVNTTQTRDTSKKQMFIRTLDHAEKLKKMKKKLVSVTKIKPNMMI